MIEIPQPSIALNAHDVPGAKYEMWETWNVPASASADWIVSFSSILATGTEIGGVKCLVINCHGDYEYGTNKKGKQKKIETGGFGLMLGQGITVGNARLFSQLRGQVKCIVIVACGAAYVTKKGMHGDGELLCSEIAKASGAYVIAPKTLQIETYVKLPKNHIDNYEGEVVRFNPSGGLEKSKLLGRKLISEVVS
jgi:hypothetical protein